MNLIKEKEKNSTTLYCFSPGVMVATFIIEISLAFYVFLKGKKYRYNFLVVAILLFLSIFQLAEFMICRGENSLIWSKVGLFAITFLPLLGFILIGVIRNKTRYVYIGLLSSIAFVVYFIFVPDSVGGAVCGGNYIILNIQSTLHTFYGYYYFGFLMLGIWMASRGMSENIKDEKSRKALMWIIIGYLSFILPLTIVYIFIQEARSGIASIMCGFALIFAIILAFKVAPLLENIPNDKIIK